MSDERPILVEGRNCWQIEYARHVSFLIDGAAYFSALASAIARAQRSVFIIGWDVNPRVSLSRKKGKQFEFKEFLNKLVAARPDLRIYVLCWDHAFIYAFEREWFPAFRFRASSHPHIHFQLDGNHPFTGSQHQKIVVIDDSIAFIGGVDLTTYRWDQPGHNLNDPQRTDPDGIPYGPVHDVQMAVDDDAAAALGIIARERWRRATDHTIRSDFFNDEAWPDQLKADLENVQVGIARTIPAYKGMHEVREVEKLYIDSIQAAKRSIYIENQYITSDLIGRMLADRLSGPDSPEIILVDHREYTGVLESNTMGVLRSRFIERLRHADLYKKLKLYYPEVGTRPKMSVNIHSKVMIIDDRFLRIGSSNLSNRSMGLDSECDIAVESFGREKVEAKISEFRNRLLAEHTGTTVEQFAQFYCETKSLIRTIELCPQSSGNALIPLPSRPQRWFEALVPGPALIDPDQPLTFKRILHELQTDRNLQRLSLTIFAIFGLLFFSMLGLFKNKNE
ncbi:MAG: hypothetical protein C5B54_06860 [Acidobacteria bacterium]|nr:MAG: hypothetical protein C5B54_06860 [Acidobacteriota bacterium]